jgi:hypothetical protein
MDAYHARPQYQQNDYIGWITREIRSDQAKAPQSNAGGAQTRRCLYEHVMDKNPYTFQ